MANQSNHRPAKRAGGINATFLGAVFLGICILIAGLNIGGNIKKLNKTIEEKVFSTPSNLKIPDNMDMGVKKYLTEAEAGEYLNLPTEKIVNLMTSGEISEYVKTENGYSVSVDVLDKWFDGEAYKTMLKTNSAGSSEDGGGGGNEENSEE